MKQDQFQSEVLSRLDNIDSSVKGIDSSLKGLDERLDELTAEVSLQRAALERFGFMGKAPRPPAGSTSGGESGGLEMAAKG